MEDVSLEAQPREEIGKSKLSGLRQEGFIPAVVYAQGKPSVSIKLSHKEIWGVIHQHRLENVVINLKFKEDVFRQSRFGAVEDMVIKSKQHRIIPLIEKEVRKTFGKK